MKSSLVKLISIPILEYKLLNNITGLSSNFPFNENAPESVKRDLDFYGFKVEGISSECSYKKL